MGIKVAKFGGSSVADAIQLSKVKDIVNADAERRYIVVSAPGKRFDGDSKITDLLYLCKTHMEHNLPYEQVLQVIKDRYLAVAVGQGVKVNLEQEFDAILEELKKGATADYVASRGEYLNAILVSAVLGFDFVDAAGLVIFDKKGRLMAEETNEALKAELAKHDKAVIPGFYGTDVDGNIRTFSRGGSDITGAIVARAVGADVYENWTDVSGFLVADPRIVPDAKPIDKISYRELRELSYMGASVLHDEAVYPAKVADIPINIRNTNRPEDKGTMITAEVAPRPEQVVTGIAGNKDFTVIGLSKRMMNNERGYIRRLAGILEDNDISMEHMPSGIDTISVVLSNKQLNGKLDDLIDEFETQLKPDSIDVFEDMALIATVGTGMMARTGTSAKLFTALAEAGINIRMIDQGSSEINIIVGVENKDFENAIKAIYSAFVED